MKLNDFKLSGNEFVYNDGKKTYKVKAIGSVTGIICTVPTYQIIIIENNTSITTLTMDDLETILNKIKDGKYDLPNYGC